MRDYVLNEAQALQTFGLAARLRRVIKNWKNHRALEKLLALDDHHLADMGLTRALVQHLVSLPLTVDVDWERERVLRIHSF
jgi:uncharacterized protein YjiS (DUF1127 family)